MHMGICQPEDRLKENYRCKCALSKYLTVPPLSRDFRDSLELWAIVNIVRIVELGFLLLYAFVLLLLLLFYGFVVCCLSLPGCLLCGK